MKKSTSHNKKMDKNRDKCDLIEKKKKQISTYLLYDKIAFLMFNVF